MSATVDLSALDKLAAALVRAQDPDLTIVMEAWEKILMEEHREGVLRGEGADGTMMIRTKRQDDKKLSSKLGSGPPLAPNREASRAITRARSNHGRADGRWFAMLGWEDFLTDDGREVLPMHADPAPDAPYPKRDILGVRPLAMTRCVDALKEFIQDMFFKEK